MLNELINKFPTELRLMLAGAIGDLEKTKYLLQQPINWDKFLRLVEHHRVYPTVYKILNKLDNKLVPGHVLDVLRQMCQDNAINTLRITGETIRLGRLLEKYDISAVVLKGTPLSWRLYGDIAIRPYGDIDILIAADKLDKSITILENEGYRKITEGISYDLTPRQLQIYLRHNQHSSHFRYWNSDKKVLLEIHWKLSKYGNVLPFPVDGSNKKLVVAGKPMQVLSDEEWLLYLILHGAGHKWVHLNWLLDINKFIEQESIDWVRLEHLAEKYGIKLFLHQALILSSQVFRTTLPHGLVQNISHDKAACRMASLALQSQIFDAGEQVEISGIYSIFLNNSYDLYMNIGLKKKFKYILKQFGPTVEHIKLVALPDRLYALYYIIVPFAFIARRLRRLIVGEKHA